MADSVMNLLYVAWERSQATCFYSGCKNIFTCFLQFGDNFDSCFRNRAHGNR